jgi:membrane protein
MAWYKDNVMRLSAAMSFYAILSLGPILVLTVRMAAIGHDSAYAREQLTKQVTSLMGPQAAAGIKPIIESNPTLRPGPLGAIISTLVLLFSATGVFIELQDSMNTIFDIKQEPDRAVWSFIHHRLLSLGMVLGMGVLAILYLFISGFFAKLSDHLVQDRHWSSVVVNVVLPFAVALVLFAAIFRLLPKAPVQWREAWEGALVAALLFTAGRYALEIYFHYSRPSDLYGAAGSLVAVLGWVYYSLFSMFFGAELTKTLLARRTGDTVN